MLYELFVQNLRTN